MKTYYKDYHIDNHYNVWLKNSYIGVVKNLHEAKDFIDKLTLIEDYDNLM